MKKALLFGVAMLGLVSCQSPARFSQAHAGTCGMDPRSECDITASAAPSGNSEWPIRLTVRNNTDREIVVTHWICSSNPHPPGIGRWTYGIGLDGGRMAPYSVKSWNFRAKANPLGENLPFCEEGFGHELLKLGVPSQLNLPEEWR